MLVSNSQQSNIEIGKVYSFIYESFGKHEVIGTCVNVSNNQLVFNGLYKVSNELNSQLEEVYRFSPILSGVAKDNAYIIKPEKICVIGEVIDEILLTQYKNSIE